MPDLDYYGREAADVYLERAARTLEAERLNPVVGMDFFPDRDGMLCGINEAVAVLKKLLVDGGEAWGLVDGDLMEAREVVLRVRAPYLSFGRYETALLGMLASGSGWATRARQVVDAAAGTRVISFGARHVHPLVGPRMEYSAVVGGCAGCATPGGAELAGLEGPSGTMPHAMILILATRCRPPSLLTSTCPTTCSASFSSTRSRTRPRKRCALPRRWASAFGACASTRPGSAAG